MNADQKLLETVFSIAIYQLSGYKWQSKTMFIIIFELRSSIVLTFLIAANRVFFQKSEYLIARIAL